MPQNHHNRKRYVILTDVDVHHETDHLDKHDEVVAQIDYSHSQVNELDMTDAPRKGPQPAVTARISHPRYWLGITAVIVLYIIIQRYSSPAIVAIIYTIVLVYMYRSITKLLRSGQKQLTLADKNRMVMFMAFTPMIGQAIYYFRLKSRMPIAASVALWIGWRVLALFILGTGVYLAIALPQSWQYRYGPDFQGDLNSITIELDAITVAAQKQDGSALVEHCEKLEATIEVTRSLPPYPNNVAQSKLLDSLRGLSRGADDCILSIRDANPDLLLKSSSELNDGYQSLKQAVNLIKSAQVL
jgi:hypothetical protein